MGAFDSNIATYSMNAGNPTTGSSGAGAAPSVNTGGTAGQAQQAAGIGAIGSVITGLASAYAQWNAGQMAVKTMTFNAKLQDIQARLILHAAKLNANRQRQQGAAFVKSQRAKYAKAGVSSEGSPITVMIDTMANIEYDALLTEINANMSANDKYLTGSAMIAKGDQLAGEATVRAGETLLTKTVDAASRYYNPKGN